MFATTSAPAWRPLALSLATALAFGVAAAEGEAPRQNEPPHVILLMADDMGWWQTSYNGHPLLKTPNLDAMAAAGLRMDRFYAGAPSCTPTRATVMTGRTNDRTGAVRVGVAIDPREQMLSTAFQQAGYATAHFGKWHLNGGSEVDRPVPKDDPVGPGALGFDYWLSAVNVFDLDPTLGRLGKPEKLKGESSDLLVREALRFIDRETKRDKRVFVVIWYSSPHRPFAALKEDAEPFAKLDGPSRDHHAELVAMDRSIGTLRQGLRERNLAHNTLIWFNSDNGGLPDIDYGPEHPPVTPDTTGALRGFKKDFYEGGLRVPGIVEWPAGIEPRVSNFPAATMDIFPTLIDVAGLDANAIHPVHDGISLAPVFRAEPERRERPIGFRAGQPLDSLDDPHAHRGLAWMDNEYKLVRNYDAPEGAPFELYNLVKDPSEQRDLSAEHPEIKARMAAELAAWNASVDRSMAGADYPAKAKQPAAGGS